MRNITNVPFSEKGYVVRTHLPGKRGDWTKGLVYCSEKRELMLDMAEFFLVTHNRVKINGTEIFLLNPLKKFTYNEGKIKWSD